MERIGKRLLSLTLAVLLLVTLLPAQAIAAELESPGGEPERLRDVRGRAGGSVVL